MYFFKEIINIFCVKSVELFFPINHIGVQNPDYCLLHTRDFAYIFAPAQ